MRNFSKIRKNFKKVIDTGGGECYIYIRSLRVTDRKASEQLLEKRAKEIFKKLLTEKLRHDILSELRLTSQDKAH